MKIDLITLHRVYNYGSVLQAYATQELLKSYGSVEIIDYITEQRTFKRLKKSKGKYTGKSFFAQKFLLFARILSLIIKEKQFGKFIKKNLNISKNKYISFQELLKNPPIADFYVAGSDQIWNSVYNEGLDEGFYLNFTNSPCKIAFSSSFGMKSVPPEEQSFTRDLLSKFKAISVREDSAQKIIKNLDMPEPIILIDPTLQISSKQWSMIASKRLVKKRYLILMLLYNEDNNATNIARKIADELGLMLVKISWDLFKDKRIDKLFTHKSPEDFLSLFKNADYVVTNSFHGLAFSLNFEKQFSIIKRNEFNSRIESLLSLTQLYDRMIQDEVDMDIVRKTIDYSNVNLILDKEKNKAKEFLSEYLNG